MQISAQAPRRPPWRIDRFALALIAGLVSLSGLAWVIAGEMMAGMDTGPGSDLGSLSFYVVAWVVMMAAMMFPSISPMVRTYALVQRSRYARRGLGEPTAAIVAFIAGYVLIWVVFGLAAFAAFKLAGAIDLVPLAWDRGGSYFAGGVILVSAIYQLTPLKDACLSRCRGPLDFLTERWRDGVGGALQLGVEHGAWCVGCCWALMAALFALGVMSIAWMTLVAALIAAEKLLPWKRPANRAIAILLAVLGLAVAFVPASVPGLTLPGQARRSMGHEPAVTGGMTMGAKKTIGMDETAEPAPRGAKTRLT